MTHSASSRKLHQFPGGLHLPDHKDLSAAQPIAVLAPSRRLVLPLQQHIGKIAEVSVRVGQRVRKGEVIAEPRGYISAPIHAPTSGSVVAIGDAPIPHPSGLNGPCVIIESDGEDTWIEHDEPHVDYHASEPQVLRERLRAAGIVGLGGAAFPTAVKANREAGWSIRTLILNGAECEPYITCDQALMTQRADAVIEGARILQHIVGASEIVIGIEDNKPDAIAAINAALATRSARDCHLVTVPTLYPTGGEKQLIKVLTGEEVPYNGLPAHIGLLCQNVGTAYAAYQAVVHGQPLLSRIVTVTGQGVARPGNFEVLLGTPIRDLIEAAGGYLPQAQRLIMGGPMMGFTLHEDTLPVTKACNCVLALAEPDLPEQRKVRECIRCGACVEVCPASLLPQQLYWYARAKDFDKVQDYNLFDCIECGCCAYACPSHIPLVQYYRYAKTEIWSAEREKQTAELARRRHDARQDRLATIERERLERLAQKQSAIQSKDGKTDKQAAKAAVEAALERVRQKNASAEPAPGETETGS